MLQNCNIRCYNSWDVSQILMQEGIDVNQLKEQRLKNINLLKTCLLESSQAKIPHVSHHIWFTSPTKPREISERDISLLEKTTKTLNSETGDWEHILWTTSKDSIPSSVAKFESFGGTVKEIKEIINNPSAKALEIALTNNAYGMASDILRYVLVKEFGGIYFDLDYELYVSLDKLTNTFDSFFGMDDFGERYFGNAFIAAKANHPILQETVNLVNRNFAKQDIPDYVKYPCSQFAKTITQTGPTVLTVAYYKRAHQDENIDIGLGHGTVFKLDKSIPGEFLTTSDSPAYVMHQGLINVYGNHDTSLAQLGNDSYSGSWIKEDFFTQIEYKC